MFNFQIRGTTPLSTAVPPLDDRINELFLIFAMEENLELELCHGGKTLKKTFLIKTKSSFNILLT